MPLPDVGWGGRDTSGLSHEQIHRWVSGADPEALAAARDGHAARGAELRAAADRLDGSHADASERWQGRDADAAAERVGSLRARLRSLSDAVGDQARSLDGVRAATERVQAAVGPPRPPALGPLAGPPAATGLPAAVAGGATDGFAVFRSAQSEEAAAREAYRAYLDDTAAAARSAPGGAAAARPGSGTGVGPGAAPPGRAPASGAPASGAPASGAPASGAPASGAPSGPAPSVGRGTVRGGSSWRGVLARAAGVGRVAAPGNVSGVLAAPPARPPVARSGPGPGAPSTAPADAGGPARPTTGPAVGTGSRTGAAVRPAASLDPVPGVAGAPSSRPAPVPGSGAVPGPVPVAAPAAPPSGAARPEHLVPADPRVGTDPDGPPRFVAPPVLGEAPAVREEDR